MAKSCKARRTSRSSSSSSSSHSLMQRLNQIPIIRYCLLRLTRFLLYVLLISLAILMINKGHVPKLEGAIQPIQDVVFRAVLLTIAFCSIIPPPRRGVIIVVLLGLSFGLMQATFTKGENKFTSVAMKNLAHAVGLSAWNVIARYLVPVIIVERIPYH